MTMARWWFRRRSSPRRDEVAVTPPPTVPARVATFSGVSREEVLGYGTGLYEVVSDGGVHITLHETELVRLDLAAAPRAELTVWCRFDPDWVPAGAEATPVVRLHFTDVVVESIEVDEEGWNPALRSDGQVRLMDYAPGDWFRLQTAALVVNFRAGHADLSLHASELD
jgi:hypothetical protein